ncbi:predicted protein [Naegleria gruberi]|uniref:Predicted protein n=1 Tax=Naegleria gruberi TaxID=5762 RepID=D2V134_NAEGR|nr:uncharacterized protein NAEGRDRAFT_35079 [Naegleria gruberi]EFC49621.1 predicted protein [Naegleria gruberi]|eukprot:XP_002682365.1 predicted protein [Naegleria gruberi strain NEG-M]
MQTPLNINVVKSLGLGKVYKGHSKEINGMDFFRDGKSLLCSSDDDNITWFDCTTLTPKSEPSKTIPSKKYGCSLVKFTHSEDACIHASNKEGLNDDIRYLNIHNGNFLRYFKGHTKKVVSLSMCPIDDGFASTSLDNTLRLWDLRKSSETHKCAFTGKPVTAYDPKGLVLAVTTPPGVIKLYDVRNLDSPFSTFALTFQETPDYSSMLFSPDGNYITVVSSDSISLIDAFNGKELFRKTNDEIRISQTGASFSPNSEFLFVGTEDGRLLTIETSSGKFCHSFTNTDFRHSGEVSACFNPQYCMLVSACQAVCFWVPSM